MTDWNIILKWCFLKKGMITMRNVIVVEVGSTGFNYIRDIANRDLNPVILDLKYEGSEANEEYKKMVHGTRDFIDVDYELITEKDTYAETLEMVREYDPLLVLPASEAGVRLAIRLANDLGLQCNPIENLDAMTLKHKMQEKIAEAGLRHIRGHVVRTVEEAIEYYDKEGLKEVVIKPVLSAGSVGVRICYNKEEMIASLNEVFNEPNLYGDAITEMVVQEYIDGEEYVVNTVSCNGDHRVTFMWKYNKIRTKEGGNVYDSINFVHDLGLGEAELVEYAYDVADALGIKYGPVHGEYMVDENGPVLIEVNCRPAGGNMDAEYLDRITGQHETDSVLDAYLNPDNFYYERNKGYKLYAYACLKSFIVPKDMIVDSAPMTHISKRLKSHHKTANALIDGPRLFKKTQDFETGGGVVYLVHEDGFVLQNDLEFLRSVEKHAFELVLSEVREKNSFCEDDLDLDEIKNLLETVKALGSLLFVSDQQFDDLYIKKVSPDKIEDVKGEFNSIVVNLNKSLVDMKDDEMTLLFLRIIDKVKRGGLVFIPESSYQFMPHGRPGAEALIQALGLKIELPLHRLGKMVIASKG